MDSGITTKWRAKELSHGLMEEGTRATMQMIKKKEMVSFTGQMVENIKEAGKMGSSMESVPTHLQVVKPNRANGLKEKDFTGSQTTESESNDQQIFNN